MCDRCANCGVKFEREEGYFLGAMYISYGLALAIITLFAVLFWLVMRWPLEKDVIWAIALLVPLAPMISRLSRVLWIYFDRAIDPD